MKRSEIRWAVLRIEGTNSEDESAQCMRDVGVQAEIVHLKQLTGDDVNRDERRKLSDFDGLWIAGGFSAGDYIRAGAIMAARMKAKLAPDIKEFIKAGKPMLGICNGFQIMVELGVLPNLDGKPMTDGPTSVLHLNDSGHYECRPSLLRHVNKGTCQFTKQIKHNDVRTVITGIKAHITRGTRRITSACPTRTRSSSPTRTPKARRFPSTRGSPTERRTPSPESATRTARSSA